VNVLFLSSQSPDRGEVVSLLAQSAHQSFVVETAAQASVRMAEGGLDLVLLDLAASAEALRFLRKRRQRPPLPTICIADRRRADISSEALRLGVADIVARPVREQDLIAAITNGREFARLADRAAPVTDAPDAADGVFGSSPAMRDVLGIVKRVAASRCGVLIVGERGSGREMVARAIHRQGPRHGRPFVKIVCTDVDPSQFDDLVNGQVEAGTIYLEELADLPAELQARLEAGLRRPDKRTQQTGEPGDARASVAAVAPARAEPRVIAGVQPRINDAVERGVVRGGLIESIAVVRIDLPPLRQRGQDVPLLATHFLKEACRRNDVPPKTFSRSALTLLSSLPWPGNAAELRALTERLAILVSRGVVMLEDVLANVRFDGVEAVGRDRGSLKNARERFERDYVTAVLQHHKGRMGAAARELGIERTNLYRKIKQLKIQWTIPD
jgi:two-component system NtrC family response regulator